LSLISLINSKQRAIGPRFPPTICDATFERTKEYITALGHADLPLALSCDDTKLHPAFRMFYDPVTKQTMLGGGVGDPIPVANADEVRKVLDEAKIQKATKVGVLVLSYSNEA
jgi:hypothetical protein